MHTIHDAPRSEPSEVHAAEMRRVFALFDARPGSPEDRARRIGRAMVPGRGPAEARDRAEDAVGRDRRRAALADLD